MLSDSSGAHLPTADPADEEIKELVVNAAGGGRYLTGAWVFSRPTAYRGVMYGRGQNFPAMPKKSDQIVYHLIRQGEDPRLKPDVIPLDMPVPVLRAIRTVRRGIDGETILNAQIIDFGALSSEAMAVQLQYLKELAARTKAPPGILFEVTEVIEVVMV